MNDRWSIEVAAEAAYEAIRSINHFTIFTGNGIPAPVLYRVLGELKTANGYGLNQALDQLAHGLERSLATYDIYEDDGRDPQESVDAAAEALRQAADLANEIGGFLDQAQSAIARQGYRTDSSIVS